MLVETSFLYAGDLEKELKEISHLVNGEENAEDVNSFSVRCGAFFTIYCC